MNQKVSTQKEHYRMSRSSIENESSSVEDNNDDVESSAAKPVDWKNLLQPYNPATEARRRVLALSASANKSTYRKVEEAVAMMGTGDAGVSVTGILTWIINNYPVLDPSKLKVNVKRAVLKGLKAGRLVRTKASRKAQGVSGSFTFPAQRIKLKAVRLEGKKYVFPILQPFSSSAIVSEDADVKKKTSVDDSPKRQSTPKRLAKSKLVSESPSDVLKVSVDNGKVSSTPKRLSKLVSESPSDVLKKVSVDEEKESSTPKRLQKSKKLAPESPSDVLKKMSMDEGKESTSPKRLPKSKLVSSMMEDPTDLLKEVSVDDSPKRQSTTTKRRSSTTPELPKAKQIQSQLPESNASVL